VVPFLIRLSCQKTTKLISVGNTLGYCHYNNQRCAGSRVQESTPAGVSVFQQDPVQDQEWIFLIEARPGAGVIFNTVVLRS